MALHCPQDSTETLASRGSEVAHLSLPFQHHPVCPLRTLALVTSDLHGSCQVSSRLSCFAPVGPDTCAIFFWYCPSELCQNLIICDIICVYVSLPHGDLGWPLEEKPAVPCGLGFSLHWHPGALGRPKEGASLPFDEVLSHHLFY